MLSKDLWDFIMNIDSPERFREQEENLAYLRNIKVSPLLEEYLLFCLRNLYIDISYGSKGSAYSLIKNEQLNGYCFDSTIVVAPFLKCKGVIQRGTIRPDKAQIIEHAWIKLDFQNKKYILDPALGLIVPLEEYESIYKQNVEGEIPSLEVTKKIIETWKTSTPYYKGYYQLKNGDINSAFYNSALMVKGKHKNKKISSLYSC